MTVLDDRIVQEVTIAAPRELVWQFFTEADRLVQWKGTDAVLDPQPGGVYRCAVTEQATAVGEYVTVAPYDEIVFTWGWEDDPVLPPGTSTVTVTLSDVDGGTHVHLEHTGLPHPAMALHDQGWTRYLPTLRTVAEEAAGQ